MRHRLPADVLLLVTVVVWGFHFVVIKYALTNGFEPLAYAALRFSLGSLLFAGITVGLERTVRVRRRDLVVLCGVLGAALYVNQIGFVYSVQLTNASTVALLFGTLPIFVAIIGWALGAERPYARYWLAAAVSFGGVALVAAGAGGGLSGDLGGVLVGLVAPATWALYSVLARPLLQRYSPYRLSTVVGLTAMLPLIVTAIPQFVSTDWGALPTLAWLALIYSMGAAYVFTNVLWFTAIDRVGAGRSSLYANLQPFLGAAFAVAILSETMGWLQIAGGVVIAAGIVIARQRRPPVEIVD